MPGADALTAAQPATALGLTGAPDPHPTQEKKMATVVKVDFKRELERLKAEVKKEADLSVEARTRFATDALKSVTPKLTGHAASRWTYEMENGVGLITNDAPYIDRLNEGHSKQAPPHFIEITLMTIGELEFPVYTTTP